MDVFVQQVINGLVLGSMYALIALGYTMVYGIINLINFAHGEVLMVAALTSWSVIGLMQESMPGLPGWVMLAIALVISSVVAASLNFAIEKIFVVEVTVWVSISLVFFFVFKFLKFFLKVLVFFTLLVNNKC
jgi:branched-subunit amino acid ABC-type transport system permease component